MKPYSDADAPSLDAGVLARMARLDPNLVVTWNKHAIDPATGRKVITEGGVNSATGAQFAAGAVEDPLFHLWRQDDVQKNVYHYIMAHPVFGNRQVLALERDAGRWINPRHILAEHTRKATARRRAKAEAASQLARDKMNANPTKVMDVMNGRRDTRSGRIYSAKGLTRRGSTGQVTPDSHESGWELPDRIQGR